VEADGARVVLVDTGATAAELATGAMGATAAAPAMTLAIKIKFAKPPMMNKSFFFMPSSMRKVAIHFFTSSSHY
jgi:hypothetical protein